MRQHTKNIKSPTLARMQIRAGGAHDGVCTAKLSEAEVMVEHGITDVLIPNQVVTADKIARLSALQRQGDVKVCVDSRQNVMDLSEIADSHGVKIGVLIEVDTSMGRAGVRSVDEGVELAKLAESLPGVDFRGVMSHQHLDGFVDTESRILTAAGVHRALPGRQERHRGRGHRRRGRLQRRDVLVRRGGRHGRRHGGRGRHVRADGDFVRLHGGVPDRQQGAQHRRQRSRSPMSRSATPARAHCRSPAERSLSRACRA